MLGHLKQRVAEVLASAQVANLATCGPTGLQSRFYPCAALGMQLYLLVPATSDQLFNLEHVPTAVASTTEWQLYGRGYVLPVEQGPPGLVWPEFVDTAGCVLVHLRPVRLQINQPRGWGYRETIDIEGE